MASDTGHGRKDNKWGSKQWKKKDDGPQKESEKLSVVFGTYHHSVAQFDFDLENGTAERKWVDDSSTKSITSIVFNGFYCMYGGNDEVVRIVKPKFNERVGTLHDHRGSLTHLAIFQKTHLLSSSDDGKIFIWRIGAASREAHYRRKSKVVGRTFAKEIDKNSNLSKEQIQEKVNEKLVDDEEFWNLQCCMENKVGRKTKRRLDAEGLDVSSNINFKILSFSVHPSGRLLLSIDNQHEMKIWDLIRAKNIVTVKMPVPAIDIQWSLCGFFYAIVREKKVMIYHKEGTLHRVLRPVATEVDGTFPDRHQQTVCCLAFLTKEMVAIGDMSSRIVVYDIESRTPVYRLKGHERDDDDNVDEFEPHNDDDQKQSAQKRNTRPRICKIKSVSLQLQGELESSLYVVSADNKGRICIWNIQDCLSCIVEANKVMAVNAEENRMDSDSGDEVDSANDIADDEKEIDSSDIDEDEDVVMESNTTTADANEVGDEEEEPDFTVDENGLFTFDALMQIDTDTHITCMDAGIVGKADTQFKWKRLKQDEPKDGDSSTLDQKVKQYAREHGGGMAYSRGMAEKKDPQKAKRLAIQRRRQKRESKTRKMDISRFD